MRAAMTLVICALLPTAAFCAEIRIEGDATFRANVAAQIEMLRSGDAPVLRKLVETVSSCSATVEVRPITADRATWHSDGNPERGHTDPADQKPKRLGRDHPTDAWVYIPPTAVQTGERLWKSGVFVHELTHAMDLVCGHYHPDGSVRERRAVWVQNYWRHRLGQGELRASYHGQFSTNDFQVALREGRLEAYEPYLFGRNDLPSTRQRGEGEQSLR